MDVLNHQSRIASKEESEKVFVKASLSVDKNTLPKDFKINPKTLHEEFEGSCIVVVGQKKDHTFLSIKGVASKLDHMKMLATFIETAELSRKEVLFLLSKLDLPEV